MINIQVLKAMFNKMDSCIKMNRGGGKSFLQNTLWNGNCLELSKI